MDIRDITIIVPTRNEEKNISIFLASVPPAIALVVVDASEDGTPEIISRIRSANTTLIRSQTRIAEARNRGAEVAKSRWLLFTDADISFPLDYFCALHSLPAANAYYGKKTSAGAYSHYYQNFSLWQTRFDRMGIPAVSGSNLLVGRELFFSAGGFDPQLLVNEDTEFGFRLKKLGQRILYAPNLKVIATDQRRLAKGLLRKNIHTLARCGLIYFNLLPQLWRGKDWGYW